MESYVCAAQENALFTKYHEVFILKNSQDDKCRACKTETETTTHILAGCEALAHKEYLERHNALAQYVHHCICIHYGVPVPKWWQSHKPEDVVMTDQVEILWDQIVQTDRECPCNRPDIVIKDKKKKEALIIDVACPADLNVSKKENEKSSKYNGLKVELARLWEMDCKVIPIVVGALGTISSSMCSLVEEVPGSPSHVACQKITLVGSQKILRSVLSRPK